MYCTPFDEITITLQQYFFLNTVQQIKHEAIRHWLLQQSNNFPLINGYEIYLADSIHLCFLKCQLFSFKRQIRSPSSNKAHSKYMTSHHQITSSHPQKKTPERYDFMIKIIIIGDSGVGKTNLITRFCQNNFKDSYVATIGVDFKIKTILIDQKKYKMQIWDTAGQQRFKNITQTYYKGAAGIVLTYSITDRISFQNIEKWISQIESNAPNDVNKVLLATKSDLRSEREVTTEDGQALARKYNIPFAEVSAKTADQVVQGFEVLVREIHKKYSEKGQFEGLVSKRDIMIGGKKEDDSENRRNCSC